MTNTEISRRTFIEGALATVVLTGFLTSCGTRSDTSAKTIVRAQRLLAAVEISVISAYQAVANGLQSGRLGKQPAVVSDFVTISQSHHQAHLDHWNQALINSHNSKQTSPNSALTTELRQGLIAVNKLTDALGVLLLAEETSGDTCASLTKLVPDATVRRWCAVVAPVEAQHASLIRLYLGQDPSPVSVLNTNRARSLADLIN